MTLRVSNGNEIHLTFSLQFWNSGYSHPETAVSGLLHGLAQPANLCNDWIKYAATVDATVFTSALAFMALLRCNENKTKQRYNHKCCVEAFLLCLWAVYGKLCILRRQLLAHRACCSAGGESCSSVGTRWGQCCLGRASLHNLDLITSICQLSCSNKELNCSRRLGFSFGCV